MDETYCLDPIHFEKFKSAAKSTQTWVGLSPSNWFNSASSQKNGKASDGISVAPGALDSNTLSRADLNALVLCSNVPIEVCVISILAWGGMNRRYGADVLSKFEDWAEIAKKIREGSISRVEAYEQFHRCRADKKLEGMGPAYYTKLIFFLNASKRKSGYIMDQWTARSVNLLSGKTIVHTNSTRTKKKNGTIKCAEIVTDKNSAADYEKYCSYVEHVASKMNNPSPSQVEEWMFSAGRGKGDWRNYVVAQKKCV